VAARRGAGAQRPTDARRVRASATGASPGTDRVWNPNAEAEASARSSFASPVAFGTPGTVAESFARRRRRGVTGGTGGGATDALNLARPGRRGTGVVQQGGSRERIIPGGGASGGAATERRTERAGRPTSTPQQTSSTRFPARTSTAKIIAEREAGRPCVDDLAGSGSARNG
jgi:hypothetical protein